MLTEAHVLALRACAAWHECECQSWSDAIRAAMAELVLLRRVVNGATDYLASELGPDADEALREWRDTYGRRIGP